MTPTMSAAAAENEAEHVTQTGSDATITKNRKVGVSSPPTGFTAASDTREQISTGGSNSLPPVRVPGSKKKPKGRKRRKGKMAPHSRSPLYSEVNFAGKGPTLPPIGPSSQLALHVDPATEATPEAGTRDSQHSAHASLESGHVTGE